MPPPKQNKALLRGYQTIIELSLNNTLIRSNKVSVRGRVGIGWGYPQISNESMGMAFFEAHVFQLLLPKNLRQSSISEMAGSTYDQGEHLVGEPRCGASWSTGCVAKVFGFKALMFYFFCQQKIIQGKKKIGRVVVFAGDFSGRVRHFSRNCKVTLTPPDLYSMQAQAVLAALGAVEISRGLKPQDETWLEKNGVDSIYKSLSVYTSQRKLCRYKS